MQGVLFSKRVHYFYSCSKLLQRIYKLVLITAFNSEDSFSNSITWEQSYISCGHRGALTSWLVLSKSEHKRKQGREPEAWGPPAEL